MSLLPKQSPEEFEELFQLFRGALIQRITPGQAREHQKQLRERLQKLWDATDPNPFPAVFDDFFRRSIMDDFYDSDFAKKIRSFAGPGVKAGRKPTRPIGGKFFPDSGSKRLVII